MISRRICDVCIRHDLYIISDDIIPLVYDNMTFTSVPSLGGD